MPAHLFNNTLSSELKGTTFSLRDYPKSVYKKLSYMLVATQATHATNLRPTGGCTVTKQMHT
jgi:hypothetical protein